MGLNLTSSSQHVLDMRETSLPRRPLPVQSLCAPSFERSKLKMSEFGMRKTLLIKKVPAEKMGVLAVSQIHLL